ncbi:PLP-dependent aminotransferase family protein [Bradyrhizobium sp. SZCCHNR1051]|uniref:aminotransferase-like domain-containing protein n=1 Tax=Bradyrhizobium sp. SZCCHNR1051 TaxID=3057355 RepID=UPI0029169F1E|nr:PLP-dependent aminotransferase family protein [Bradyrhizobium sp. SZCCHNR1051]
MLEISDRLGEPILDTMCFLNDVVERYPEAISFAPGRPAAELFNVAQSLDVVRKHASAILGRRDVSPESALNEIAQYGRTNGIVHEHVARQLMNDEGLSVESERLVITHGCQEAMLLLLLTVFTPPRDVLLATEPVYQGITAAARLLGIEVVPIRLQMHGPDLDQLEDVLARLGAEHKVPRAFYIIPDFDNPSGYTTSLETRLRLVALARRRSLLLLEDSPYRMLRYEGPPLPLLKSIDPGQVVLLGSYSKSVYPGLRLGYLTGDVPVSLSGRTMPLSEVVSKAKSLVSINTSPVMQAVLASVLIEERHSLQSRMVGSASYYRKKRDVLLAALDRHFAGKRAPDVRWNRPEGGFFVTLEGRFAFTMPVVEACASSAGVIVVPMSLFAFATPHDRSVRLSFSAVPLQDIDEGVSRLAGFFSGLAQSEQRLSKPA